MTDLTPDDMSNLFRFFRVPTQLYNEWSQYATTHKQTMKEALTNLLRSVRNTPNPLRYEDMNYIDIAIDWSRTQPKILKEGLIKQFHFQYTPELHNEIFYIFQQTGYKNGTIEMNKEICTRLAYALKLRRVVVPLRVLFLTSPPILSHRECCVSSRVHSLTRRLNYLSHYAS